MRGAPEMLQVPASLCSDGRNTLLEHAAEWLHMKVQVVADAKQAAALKKLPSLQALLDDLVLVGLDEIRRRNAGQPLTVKEVQDAVLSWIRMSDKGFANHTLGLDDSDSRKHGYAAPAFATPAAGLLLPVIGNAITVRDGIMLNGRRFGGPYFRSEPGHTVVYRAFPYLYDGLTPNEGMEEALYVEDYAGVIQYVTPQ